MLKFIFTLFLIFFLLPPLFKWLIRMFVSKQVSKVQEEFYRKQQPQGQTNRREGEIKVEVPQDDRKKKGFDGGEYVDYEEVK